MNTKFNFNRLKLLAFVLPGWLCLLLANSAFAQNVVLDTQAEVDAFLLTDITEVEGTLQISMSDVANLDGLANLTTIGGDLNIQFNDTLENIDGLSNITSVGGGVNIAFNPLIENLDGLGSLLSAGALRFEGNSNLVNLNGLSNLLQVTQLVLIADNASLVEYCGLYNLLALPGVPLTSVSIFANALDPTVEEIIAAGACPSNEGGDDVIVDDPVGAELSALEALLEGLIGEGVLNKGQANAIAKIASNAPPHTLINKMAALSRSGKLGEAEIISILEAAAASNGEEEVSEEPQGEDEQSVEVESESEEDDEVEASEETPKLKASKSKGKAKGKSK